MNPYFMFAIKTCSVFVAALVLTGVQHKVTGQISLYDALALIWPGIVGVGVYWGFIADSTPAPWKDVPPSRPPGG